ncbi:hypothetical protein H9P43_004896 [Blastocladiella emersonii ATCC 22665]|nr:hypothetical protein H9P43_004896 [Blastocladiella emersonii ATCC 22665]
MSSTTATTTNPTRDGWRIKDVIVSHEPEWTPLDDQVLGAALRTIGVPKASLPPGFTLMDPDLKFASVTWDEVAKEMANTSTTAAKGKTGAMCCFRFFGHMQGKLAES